jgi:hypothetical protein
MYLNSIGLKAPETLTLKWNTESTAKKWEDGPFFIGIQCE